MVLPVNDPGDLTSTVFSNVFAKTLVLVHLIAAQLKCTYWVGGDNVAKVIPNRPV